MGMLMNGINCKFIAHLWQFVGITVSFQNLVLKATLKNFTSQLASNDLVLAIDFYKL